MKKQLAGHLLVECLIAQGVTHVFGVPGESYLAVLDGFHHYQSQIKFVINRQEAGAAFMAEAQGKLSGRPGVCFVTRGPGATNASIGVHTAFQDSSPMVLFVGDVDSQGRDREAFQELDFSHFFGPSTKGMAKRVERIDSPERIPEVVARAFATAMNGRPGPVVVVLPEDMLTQTVHVAPLPKVLPVENAISASGLKQIQSLLENAKTPMVIAGGPAWNAAAAKSLQKFAENWNLPVANAFRFQDCFDNHHPLYIGDIGIGINPELAQKVRQSDLLLVIGPRLGEMTTGGYSLIKAPKADATIIHIHVSPDELNRVYQTPYAYCATMQEASHQLSQLQVPSTLTFVWRQWTEDNRQNYLHNIQVQEVDLPDPSATNKVRGMAQCVQYMQKKLPANALICNGAGNFASWLHRYFQYHGWSKGEKTQLAPTNGAMGYGVPAGIGASITTGRLALVMTGDGDFMMNGQELATAVQYGAKVIVVLLNNGMYGTIRMHQEREFPTHTSGSYLHNPDFVALAKAYGLKSYLVQQDHEFAAAFDDALAHSESCLIEVLIDPELITTRSSLQAIRQSALKSSLS